MKKLMIFISVMFLLASCGSYNTYSGGKENVSYIVVLQNKSAYNKAVVAVNVDGVNYTIKKVSKLKNSRKAIPITIEPGKHSLEVSVDGNVIKKENIFIGLQETKRIVLP